jgi:hypothetical protein
VLEKKFEDELTLLIDKYTPNQTVKFWAEKTILYTGYIREQQERHSSCHHFYKTCLMEM